MWKVCLVLLDVTVPGHGHCLQPGSCGFCTARAGAVSPQAQTAACWAAGPAMGQVVREVTMALRPPRILPSQPSPWDFLILLQRAPGPEKSGLADSPGSCPCSCPGVLHGLMSPPTVWLLACTPCGRAGCSTGRCIRNCHWAGQSRHSLSLSDVNLLDVLSSKRQGKPHDPQVLAG